MPSSSDYKRDYKREKAIRSTPKDLKENASRKAARRKLEKAGTVKKGDGKDVDHKNRNPLSNGKKNLRAVPKTTNRSFNRKTKAAKYGNGKRK